MLRRTFFGTCAGAAAASVAGASFYPPPVEAHDNFPSLAWPVSGLPPFSLSVMLWTVYPKLPFDQRIAKVSEAGFTALELVDEYKNWTKQDYTRFRTTKKTLGITIDATSGINHSLCDAAQRSALLQEIQAQLEVLEELECRKLILLTGDKVPGKTHAEMRANCIEALKRAADLAAAKNVTLLLENIDPEENPNYFLTSVAEGFEIVRSVANPHVKFLYDFFHEQIAEGNLIAKLAKNLDIIDTVHVADVPGRHDPGTGEINYPNIFRKLGELNFKGYVAMEFVPEGETVAALTAAREMAIKFGSVERAQPAQNFNREAVYASA